MAPKKHTPVIHVYDDDLPSHVSFGESVAVDTETMGLNFLRDRLCLVQLSFGDGQAHLIKIAQKARPAPRLQALLEDPSITKIFHFARFDVATLRHFLGIRVTPIYCTKIASRLVRTYAERHGLKDLCKELLGIDMNKQEQTSDWGSPDLTSDQMLYAACDVIYLHQLKSVLDDRLKREGRADIARACFDFLPAQCALDLMGMADINIFSH